MDDVADHVVRGVRYVGVRFSVRLATETEGRPAHAEISLDNVGRLLTSAIEQTQVGVGGTVRVSQGLAGAGAWDWSLQMDVLSAHVDAARVTLRLGYDPQMDKPAVRLRFDPQTATGLF